PRLLPRRPQHRPSGSGRHLHRPRLPRPRRDGGVPGRVAGGPMTDRRTYTGHAAAPGTALGVVHRTDRPLTRTELPHRADGDPTQQIIDAFDAVAVGLLDLSTSLREQGKDEQADIMEVNSYIAQDQDLRDQAVKRANDGEPVAVAVRQAIGTYAATIAAL